LDWIGLDWIGLDWIGLIWIGLIWFDWFDLVWSGLLLICTRCRVKSGSQVVTVSKGSRQLNKRLGELEQLYLDSEGLRISRGDNGLLYLYVKEETIGER